MPGNESAPSGAEGVFLKSSDGRDQICYLACKLGVRVIDSSADEC